MQQRYVVKFDEFVSISEAASFWESHDSNDYEDIMEEVEFEDYAFLISHTDFWILAPVFQTLDRRIRFCA